MEVRGFLPKAVIAEEAQYAGLSPWARDLLEAGAAEILREHISITTPDDARWQAIRAACAAVSQDVGVLFDLQDEYSVVFPESVAIKSIVAELTGSVTREDWEADDILGWVYQYYNVSANAAYKERRRQRGYRMTADDMIVGNQFYTPHWVVRVLVDNTLGRIWWESIPDLTRRRCGDSASPADLAAEEKRLRQICRERCAYLVPLPHEQRLGWWGEEARANAEIAAEAETRKRHVEAGGNSDDAPPPPAPSVTSRLWKQVRELKIIDPACGSAHFLLYVFDVLRRMYEVELPMDAPPPEMVPDFILRHNLHGIDVDLRACQLATFNLYLKARLAYREITGRDDFHPSTFHVVCAGARVTNGENRRELLQSFENTPVIKELAEGILTHLSRTAEIGSLLKVREQFAPLLKRQKLLKGKAQQQGLFEQPDYQRTFIEDQAIEELNLPKILESLARFEAQGRPGGDVGRLIFAHEMTKSCGLVSILSEHYDVALMNPPYGKMPPSCRDYCRGNRQNGIAPHYPNTSNNLYAAFIEKCADLIGEGKFVGMLTSQTFMNLTTFRKTREDLLNRIAPPEVLCDTGFGVLDGAKVVTAATVLRKQVSPDPKRACICVRMFQESEEQKESVLADALESLKKACPHPRVFFSSVATFATLPTSVYAYWVPSSIARVFGSWPPLDRDVARKPAAAKIADANVGLQTGDDDRFVRFFWEAPRGSLGTGKEESFAGRYWNPFAKGGWLDAYQADVMCVINWANDAAELRSYDGAYLRNEGFYFREGISWHMAPQYPSNQLRMNARLLPKDSIFTMSVNALFTNDNRLWPMLGYLNSELVFYLIRIFELRKILVGTVAALPFPQGKDLSDVGRCAFLAHQLLLLDRTSEECSPYFVVPAILSATASRAEIGRPEGHIHATRAQWPDENVFQNVSFDLRDEIEGAFADHGSATSTLRQLSEIAQDRRTVIHKEVVYIQEQIDRAVYDLFGVSPEDRPKIAEEIVFRQCQPPITDDTDDDEEPSERQETSESPPEVPAAQVQDTGESYVRDQVARFLSYAVKIAVANDKDGIVPVVQAGDKRPLAERIKSQIAEWFGVDQLQAKWSEAAEILGKPVEEWLAVDYFDYHVNMYWRRPIFWQLTSAYCMPRGRLPGCFSCLIDYQKLRANTLQDILSHYVARVQEAIQAQYDATRTVLEGAEQRGANRRELSSSRRNFEDADRRLREITEFIRRLRELDTGARPVTPPAGPNASWVRQKIAEVTGGPAYGGRGWLPVIDYGVRVNIEPLKAAQVIHRAADRIS
jgi:hypothetical protein